MVRIRRKPPDVPFGTLGHLKQGIFCFPKNQMIMVTIEPNKLIIEFDPKDVNGLEADTLSRLYPELIELLQCALILNENGERKITERFDGTMSLLKSIAPSLEDLERIM